MNRTTVIGNRVGVLFQSLLPYKTMVGMCKICVSIALIAPQHSTVARMERPAGSRNPGRPFNLIENPARITLKFMIEPARRVRPEPAIWPARGRTRWQAQAE